MSQPHDNWLLLSLSEHDQARLKPELQQVRLESGRPLYRPGEHTEYAYFPLDCLVSTVYITARTAAEIALTGREGVVGMEVLLHDIPIPRLALVHTSGAALRIRAEVLKQECAQGRALREAFMRYMQALVSQMQRLSLCKQHHSLSQQFSRLLLARLEWVGGDEVELSHELLAGALGISPGQLTGIAMDFWREGIIDQEADHMRVLDRAALEARACDCFQAIREQYDRLLPGWRVPSAPRREGATALPPLSEGTRMEDAASD